MYAGDQLYSCSRYFPASCKTIHGMALVRAQKLRLILINLLAMICLLMPHICSFTLCAVLARVPGTIMLHWTDIHHASCFRDGTIIDFKIICQAAN